MPVVVNMAHEAKPHLAGLSLMLLAILAACRYVETGKTRWWAVAGALCGAAFGMVISSLIIFIILPVMTLLRPMRWVERISRRDDGDRRRVPRLRDHQPVRLDQR